MMPLRGAFFPLRLPEWIIKANGYLLIFRQPGMWGFVLLFRRTLLRRAMFAITE